VWHDGRGKWLEGGAGRKEGGGLKGGTERVMGVAKESRVSVIEEPAQYLQVSSLDISNCINSTEGFHLQYQTLASPGTH